MAVTKIWAIHDRVSRVVDYCSNPEKTRLTDLEQVLIYAANKAKTLDEGEQSYAVTGINCRAETAAQEMSATQRRFGKTGGNVAYHGYQSFKTGEVTPEQAHQIGIETAQRMWGDEYEILVTTHLNTDNIHNHLIANSVSFRTGKKFENHVKVHYRLREISDEICREHCLSVLYGSDFYGGEKGAYWVHRAGSLTHRDVLNQDLEECLLKLLPEDKIIREGGSNE